MKKHYVRGKAQTVLGLIGGDKLGITLPHEHLFCDLRCSLLKAEDLEGKELSRGR